MNTGTCPSFSGCRNQWSSMLVCQTFVPWTFQAYDKGVRDLSYGWRKSELSGLCSHAELCPPQPLSVSGLGTKLESELEPV